MSKSTTIAIIEGLIIIVLIFAYFQTENIDPTIYEHRIDSLKTLNERSLLRSQALEDKYKTLEIEKELISDSLKNRKREYNLNTQEYGLQASFIESANDSTYTSYIRTREVPIGYGD